MGLKCVLGLLICSSVLRHSFGVLHDLPYAFLSIVLISCESQHRNFSWTFPRLLLVSNAVLQTLYVFPLPESQRAFGTVLILVAGVVCLYDAFAVARRMGFAFRFERALGLIVTSLV